MTSPSAFLSLIFLESVTLITPQLQVEFDFQSLLNESSFETFSLFGGFPLGHDPSPKWPKLLYLVSEADGSLQVWGSCARVVQCAVWRGVRPH